MATSSELKKLLAAYKANLKATEKNAANALKKSLALYDQDYANTQTSLANALNSDITTMNQNNDANMLRRGIARSDIASNTANKNEGALRTANAEQLAAALLARNTNRAGAQSAYDTAIADAQNTYNENQLNYLNLLSQMNSGSGGGGGGRSTRTASSTPTTSPTTSTSTGAYVPTQSYADAYNKGIMPEEYRKSLEEYYGKKKTYTRSKKNVRDRYKSSAGAVASGYTGNY